MWFLVMLIGTLETPIDSFTLERDCWRALSMFPGRYFNEETYTVTEVTYDCLYRGPQE